MAVRLIVEKVGDDFRLVRKMQADMVLPEPLPPSAGEAVIAELRGEHDEPLYQQNITASYEAGVEVFSPEGIRRVEIPEAKLTLMLLVPDTPGARSLVFLRATPRSGRGLQPASMSKQELGRVSLADVE